MNKFFVSFIIVVSSVGAFAQGLPTENCTFSMGPMAFFKTVFTLTASGVADGQLTVMSQDDRVVGQMAMKEVPSQGTSNHWGRKEVLRLQLTPTAVLPDLQALVMYQSYPQEGVQSQAALQYVHNGNTTMIPGICVYEAHQN